MKLWLDDMRDAPDDSWTVIRKVQPAIIFLTQFWDSITAISLDHDIENRPDDETFKPVAYYIGALYTAGFHIAMDRANREGHATIHSPSLTVHSDNPVGAKEMMAILKDSGLVSCWTPYTSQADFAQKYGL